MAYVHKVVWPVKVVDGKIVYKSDEEYTAEMEQAIVEMKQDTLMMQKMLAIMPLIALIAAVSLIGLFSL